MTLVHRRLEVAILACRLLPCELLRGWRHFLGVLRSGFLFRSRLRFHPIGSVKTDSRAPVAFIKHVSAVVEAPPRGCPKQTHCWWSHPNAWDPIIIHVPIGPVTGSPHIAFDRTGRLLHYRQNRRSDVDRYAYLCDRRRQRQGYK